MNEETGPFCSYRQQA